MSLLHFWSLASDALDTVGSWNLTKNGNFIFETHADVTGRVHPCAKSVSVGLNSFSMAGVLMYEGAEDWCISLLWIPNGSQCFLGHGSGSYGSLHCGDFDDSRHLTMAYYDCDLSEYGPHYRDDTWRRFTFQAQGAALREIWVDKTLVAYDNPGRKLSDPSSVFYLGADYNGDGGNCRIARVYKYSHLLSGGEVAVLVDADIAPNSTLVDPFGCRLDAGLGASMRGGFIR